MHNHEEIQGQKVVIANDITKQNISVSKYIKDKYQTLIHIYIYIIDNFFL